VHNQVKRAELIGWKAKVKGKLQSVIASGDRGDRGGRGDCGAGWQYGLVVGGWDEVAICLWERPSNA
jgi:hypothetical protein